MNKKERRSREKAKKKEKKKKENALWCTPVTSWEVAFEINENW